MLKIKTLSVGSLCANCHIVYCSEALKGIIVDPGDDAQKIIAEVKALGLSIEKIVLTHAHSDHMLATAELKQHYNVPVALHEKENEIFGNARLNLTVWIAGYAVTGKGDILLREGDVVSFGNESMTVLHTPGHTKGCICLLGGGVLISGDTLFAGTYGRTDFPTGDAPTLAKSLERLLALPEETQVYPGHEGTTTIGNEKKYNAAAEALIAYNKKYEF